MNKKIAGVFQTEEAAISAIKKLKSDGYMDSEISVLARQKDESERIAEMTDAKVENRLSKGVGRGAATGGTLAGIGALLVELGVLAIPGVGPFLAVGPIVGTLGGIVAGGAIGGTVGVLVELGFNKKEANEYENYLDRGDILVLVEDKGIRDLVYKNFYENESVIRDMYEV